MAHIRTQVFDGPGRPLRLVEHTGGVELAPGEALVALRLATICGSDLHSFDGVRETAAPCVLGHEGIGHVVQQNDRVDCEDGDRVTWSIADTCGHCAPCTRHDLPEKCVQLFKYGHAALDDGTGLNGCFATHVVVRRGTHMVRIPKGLSDAAAAPANCALATAVNAVSQISVPPRVAVVQGGGLLGLYTCALLREAGAESVLCIEPAPARQALAERFGATPIDGGDLDRATEEVLQRVGPADVVLEMAGVRAVLTQGMRLLRNGGFYGLVGLVHPDSDLPIRAEDVIRRCLTLRGVHNYAPRHLDAAVAFLSRNATRLPFDELVSPPFPLTELAAAFDAARERTWARVGVVST
ncbi:MAG: alcohol dehydrogenase catalytic domain-containing protein [Planctomycetes bacterium]|nr:alcohol dehydrogenase catalytic domain-containing protein [Planctomycetota bacterium]